MNYNYYYKFQMLKKGEKDNSFAVYGFFLYIFQIFVM